MCGIAGLLQGSAPTYAPDEARWIVERMLSKMAHRGPDGSGVWQDEQARCTLGHRRLSILDLSDAGTQPMRTVNGRWSLTFNGEIYNFPEVRAKLERIGRRFRTQTDTEVLLEALAEWGPAALGRLDGMFAFAAFDCHTGDLFLARDPFGEKPLYIASLQSGGVAFASELQALEQLPGFRRIVDPEAVAELITFQYIAAPRTIYAGASKLAPGTWMRIGHDGSHSERYFNFRPGATGFVERPIDDLVDELEALLIESIRRRLRSDVPLGAFLSGGVDSSLVCALVCSKLDRHLSTFSIGFENAPESEHETARAVARHLGTDHRDEIIPNNISEFLMNIGSLLDEPNADSSCMPVHLLSCLTRQHVTVALSGDGADELFGGYARYFLTLTESDQHRRGERPEWKPGEAFYGNRVLIGVEEHVDEVFDQRPAALTERLATLRTELNNAPNLLHSMRQTDMENYLPGAVLPKVDRMSMRHSLEVRTPFLNTDLARFAERIPDSLLVQGWNGKLLLKRLAYRYLPQEIIDLPKKGFGLPLSDWSRRAMLETATELLSGDSRCAAMFGSTCMATFLKRQNAEFSPYQVWAFATLESWLRHHAAEVPFLGKKNLAA